jgi:hypothetical protein
MILKNVDKFISLLQMAQRTRRKTEQNAKKVKINKKNRQKVISE